MAASTVTLTAGITRGDMPRARTARDAHAGASLAEKFRTVRAQTEALCAPLETEDFVVSTMTDVSPTKWHLAHTSWFFETFVLGPFTSGYVSPNPRYAFLFNSYYVQAGERHCRAQRGLVTRPTVGEIFAYRAHVDRHMLALIAIVNDDPTHPACSVIELGLHHEQQHQELLITDIKHVFWMNPLRPSYAPAARDERARVAPLRWQAIAEGVYQIGHAGNGFCFDNERPVHRVFVDAFRIASRLVTNAEYREFIQDGGYRRPELWLSNGWARVQNDRWEAPLYWERDADGWREFTVGGDAPLVPASPVCHVSYFEADAFARWAGHRLPTEAEWEISATPAPVDGQFSDAARFHPMPAGNADDDVGLMQLYGDAWQWTQSPYVAYPGYVPQPGAIGEYNGKWMCDQWVLRGASCATPQTHARPSYRNFFPSDARWQFTGIRLAAT
jgi:ergothioneine biosynthesis protein EgtB